MFTIPVAMDRIPNFLADPNSSDGMVMPHHRCTVHVNCEDTGMIEEAYLAAKAGTYSKRYMSYTPRTAILLLENIISDGRCSR